MNNITYNKKILLAIIGIICLYVLFSVKYSVQNLTYQKKYMVQDLTIENGKLRQIYSHFIDLTKYSRIQDIASTHLKVRESKTNQIKNDRIKIMQMNETFNKVGSNSWRYKQSIYNYIQALPKNNHVY